MQHASIRSLKKASADVSISEAQRKYIQMHFIRLKKVRIMQFILLLLFVTLWEGAAYFKILDPFLYSSPSRIVKSFVFLATDGSIFYHIWITLLETIVSFSLVTILGILLAVLLWWNETLSMILEPYLVILNSIPKSALAPVFIVWLGNNMKTIIVAAVSIAIFGSIVTLYSNFQTTEEDKVKLIYTLGGKKKDVLFKVVIPANVPSIISNMKVNIGLSLVGVIIGEFLAAKAGLGYLIIYGSQVFKLDWVIMSVVILCVLASLFYKLLTKVEKRFGSY